MLCVITIRLTEADTARDGSFDGRRLAQLLVELADFAEIAHDLCACGPLRLEDVCESPASGTIAVIP